MEVDINDQNSEEHAEEESKALQLEPEHYVTGLTHSLILLGDRWPSD